MELRSNSHLHFISAIRHAEVIKVLNRSRGKPTLAFKNILDVYDFDDRASADSPVKPPKNADRSLGEFFDCVKIKIETVEEQKPLGNDQQNSDLDDLSFSQMTLRELKETCKARKRKASRSINVSQESIVTCPAVKQEHVDLQPEEDELDLEETLSSWKFKLSKTLKDKKKHKHVSGSFKSCAVVCRLGEILGDQDNQQSNRDIHVPTRPKVEISEYDYPHRQNLKSSLDDYSSVSNNQEISSEKTANEVVGTDEDRSSKLERFSVSEVSQGCGFTKVSDEVPGTDSCTQKLDCLSDVEKSEVCKLNQVSYEHLDDDSSVSNGQGVSFKKLTNGIMETDDSSPSKLESLSVSEASQVFCCTEVSDKVRGTDNGCTPKLNFLPQCCSFTEVSDGVTENGGGFTQKLKPFSNLEESVGCELSKVSYKHLDYEFLLDVDSSISNYQVLSPKKIANGVLEINSGNTSILECLPVSEASQGCTCAEASDEGPGIDGGCAQNLDSLSNEEESEGCKLNQISYKHLEDAENSSDFLGISEFGEFVHVDDLAITGDKSLAVPAISLMQGEDIANIMPCEESPETTSPVHDNSDCDKSVDSSHVRGLPVLINRSADVHVHCTNVQSVESSSHGEVFRLTDDNEDYMLLEHPIAGNNSVSVVSSASKFYECMNTVDVVASEDYDTTVTLAEGRKSYAYEAHNAPRNCCADDYPSEDKEVVTRSSSNENFDHQELQHPPERLFSARKTISPTSQERLSRLIKCVGLHDNSETPEHGKKLCYENRCHNSASLAKSDLEEDEVVFPPRTPECIKAEITSNTGKTVSKSKDQMKCLRSKCSTKVPQPTHVLPHLYSGRSSIQSCSKSAVAFSKQQMHDIKRLATKLMKELCSMKEIAVGTLHSETRTGTTRYNINEVRVAVEHATKVEETTKKWLSMMQRDCNRFCKIMSFAEEDSSCQGNTAHEENAEKKAASPRNMVHKERKITFADEAGGRLCHVRFYEESINSPLESQLENEELMAT